ncbi:ecdysone-inducible gene E3 [Calliopsis andreniformis]|uniref:ecdysone-inducible gene E3 n=1 Tax=Calliopsis andreniformis TaxID=337506 RepID=UPI003FCEE0D7
MRLKTICGFFVVLLLEEAIGGTVRKPPAFAKPVYSDSYLPAAMQVIFHAVEQLKLLQSEKTTTSSISPTTPICHTAQYQGTGIQEASNVTLEITTQSNEDANVEEEGGAQVEGTTKEVENSTRSSEIGDESMGDSSNEAIGEVSTHQEAPEVNEETPETNYATPEVNYEPPEDVHGIQETNQEIPEENQEWSSSASNAEASSVTETKVETTTKSKDLANSSFDQMESIVSAAQEKKEATIESVVQNVYEILKPTPSIFEDEELEASGESKNAAGVSLEKLEEEDDENRFSRLGEKVTQVPRPSLISYLRRSKVPPSTTLQQLAVLYDSLSKDAKRQGFGKYSGYSDEVLNTLESSAEGGLVPQLKKILDKIMERNELTREDAKIKTTQTLRDLENPSSLLGKELRPLLPLRYSL